MEIKQPEQAVQKKNSPPPPPPRVNAAAETTPANNNKRPQQKPRRRRIRSELDRLLSDEGTRNMLKGLKKPLKKPVFSSTGRSRVAVDKATVGRGSSNNNASTRVFRKPIAAAAAEVTSSNRTRGSDTTNNVAAVVTSTSSSSGKGRGGGGGASGRGRSVSPGKTREVNAAGKIDCKFVCVSRRGGVGWVTVVQNASTSSSGDVGGGERREIHEHKSNEESSMAKERDHEVVVDRATIGGSGGGGGGKIGGGGVGGGVSVNTSSPTRGLDGGWGVKVLQSIDSAIRSLEQDPLVSVIVLQSSHSRYFCNGIDLSELIGSSSSSRGNLNNNNSNNNRGSTVVKAMKSLISTLNSSRKVLVASVTGDCVGFGVMVLPLFDLVYANDKSTFRVHYNALGQSPEGVALFGNLVVSGKLTSLLYLNTPLTATEAHQSGLVHEILWPARYQETLASRLSTLSSQGPLVCASKSIVRNYRKPVKIPDLNSEFSVIEEQWGSSEFQDVARRILSLGYYDEFEFSLWGSNKIVTPKGGIGGGGGGATSQGANNNNNNYSLSSKVNSNGSVNGGG